MRRISHLSRAINQRFNHSKARKIAQSSMIVSYLNRKSGNNDTRGLTIFAAIVAGLVSAPLLRAEKEQSHKNHFQNKFESLNAILVNNNHANKSENKNVADKASISAKSNSHSNTDANRNHLSNSTKNNINTTSYYNNDSSTSLVDWDGKTVHVTTNFLIIGNDYSSLVAYNFIKDKKKKNENIVYENDDHDHIVDLNVDLKIVMMSSGKIIKYDQLLLASDNTNSHLLEDHAPIDRRAISLLCNLNKKHNISVGIKNKYDMESHDTNASSIKDGENLKLQNIINSWNGKMRRKHATIIGGGLKGVQTAFHMCDNVLGKSPKFPRISLICAENGPLTRYLPRYLSNVVASKMNKCGILLNSFSVVQYIAPIGSGGNNDGENGIDECEIFACRTYDTQTTFNFTSNALIFAPTHTQANTNWVEMNRVDLEINKEHGGIMVNNELAACTSVYVSGDLCSFPSRLGRRRMQGSHDHDVETGTICAKNMLVNFRMGESSNIKKDMDVTLSPNHMESLSMINRYHEEPAVEIQIGGTQFACIGLCNSAYETNSFWKASKNTGNYNIDDDHSNSATQRIRKTFNKIVNYSDKARNSRLAKEKFNEMCEKENIIIPSTIFDRHHDSGYIVYIRNMEIVGIMLWKNLSKKELYEQELRKKNTVGYDMDTIGQSTSSLHKSVQRAKAYLQMPAKRRTLIAPPPPYSRSLESMEFTKHVGRYVLDLKSVEEMNSYTRRYEASRAAKYGLKEKTLPSIPETEILYFSQGKHIGNGSWSPSQNGLSSQNTDKVYSTKTFRNAQDQSTDILFGGNKKYAW